MKCSNCGKSLGPICTSTTVCPRCHYENLSIISVMNTWVVPTLEPTTYPISKEGAKELIGIASRKMNSEDPKEVPGGSTPSQYSLPKGAKELQDLIEYREMNFAIGNIFKAAYRIGVCNHSDKMRDLQKIKWFVEKEIAAELKRGREGDNS